MGNAIKFYGDLLRQRIDKVNVEEYNRVEFPVNSSM